MDGIKPTFEGAEIPLTYWKRFIYITYINTILVTSVQKKNTKHSSNTLMYLVFFFSERTLSNKYIPICYI
jgi:hypothetical protein